MHQNDLVLGDLGLARDAAAIVKTSKTTGMGTICYMAPEIVKSYVNYSKKISSTFGSCLYNK
jgi:serine/threonine protein kinase